MSYSGGQPSFQEMTINGFDRIVVLSQYLIILLIVADFGFRKPETPDTTQDTFARSLAYLAFVCLLYVMLTMALHLLVLLIKHGQIITKDVWNALTLNGLEWVSPSFAMCLSILLFFLRFLFISAVIYAVNKRCKKTPYGYLAGIALYMLEVIVYYNFAPYESTGILPFEHARLEYALNLTTIPALDITISVAYWGVLIAAVWLIDHVASKLNRSKTKV